MAEQEKDKKNKLINFWARIWLFIKSLPQLFIDTFMWLIFSYVSILINIILIMGMKSVDFLCASKRLEVISSILATNVCFLVGIIYTMYVAKSKKRKNLFGLIILAAIASTVLSVLIIIKTEIILPFDMGIVYFGVIGTLTLSVLVALISKYDENKAMIQESANQSRGIKTLELDGQNFKM